VAGGPHAGTWSRSPQELVDWFDEHTAWLLAEPGVERRKMFGYPACFANGHMFTGLHQDRWVIRLPDDARTALAEAGGTPFEVMPGRPMREYLVLPATLASDPAAMRPWLERALANARDLPPKKR
jgi:TfoX/Sxy family transcriptional regulator of competence genes